MKTTKIAIIEKDKNILDRISSLLKNIPNTEVIHTGETPEDLEVLLGRKAPVLVLVGPSCTLEAIEGILKSYFTTLDITKVVIMVKQASAELLKKAIKLNVYDVLESPFNYGDVKDVVRRAEESFEEVIRSQGIAEKEGMRREGPQKVTIFSTKGGSGKSFIATNLAVDLINQSKKRVSIFDTNYQFGDVALMLNLYPKNTVHDLIPVIDQLDPDMLNSFLATHSSGVKVLPAPIDPAKGESISIQATMKILNTLSKISDYVVIDTPSAFSDNVLSILEDTDYLCVVASMEVPSIKNLKLTLELLEQLNLPKGRIIVILNRANSKVGITLGEIEQTIQRKVDVTIPSDRLVPLTINKGEPLVTEAPRSPISRSIRKLTEMLLGS
ncbi:MAG: P-loop NTPase [Actinobacteria bacterium]|nr:P-loop NTPase [Actinomycetota bacterium]